MDPITKAEAKLQGVSRYFTGKPCKHGHLAERRVSDGHCIVCHDAWDRSPQGRATREAWYSTPGNLYARDQKRKPYLAAKWAKRHATMLGATPRWADPIAIAAFYAEAARLTAEQGRPFHVDHIVPLISDRVCGLHCEANLQILEGRENASKGNRRWPDMPS